MHQTLDIPELLAITVGLIDKADQARMARVCRSFWPIAAMNVWRTVPDVIYLLKLSPGGGDVDAVSSSIPLRRYGLHLLTICGIIRMADRTGFSYTDHSFKISPCPSGVPAFSA